MNLKKCIVPAVIALLLVAGWLWLGPVAILLALCAVAFGFFFYVVARLFFAVINRLDR